ncbi:MAG: hypothetical protein HW394_1159 [Acidobacteria bacterium]|nr:hypothetical protein [Acidobacteriota bacterium]
MKKRFLCAVVLGVWSFVLPGPVRAHHGDAGRYIAEVTSLTGTVVQFVMVNPHAFIVLDVTENGETTRWTAELNGPQALARDFGWTSATTKKWVGSRFTVMGRRLKSGAPYMNLTERAKIVLADAGQEIFRTANFGNPAPAAEQ